MSEFVPSLEHEVAQERWLGDLANFIVEAGRNGWAAEAPKVEKPQRPGFKELSYKKDEWEYRDSYAGYYMGPGSSVVYFKDKPVWYMSYGGSGQNQRYYDMAKETYVFLRKALMQPDPNFPVRGPKVLWDGDESQKKYTFNYDGDLACGNWSEWITEKGVYTFQQQGEVSLIIDKDESRQPIFPWNL